MFRTLYLSVFVLGLGLISSRASDLAQVPANSSGETYVLVHGAWGGGWAWKDVQRLLEAKGHTVYRPTLTGHGERSHLASSEIDLSLHVQDVVNLLEWERLEDVVLVGHSYGGMVVTGAADRVPGRIKRLVYLDALVPEDGESLNSAFGRDSEDSSGPGQIEDGFSIPPWVPADAEAPHDVPHSIRCFSEPLSLENEARLQLATTYVYLVDPGLSLEQDTFYPFYRRAVSYGWPVVVKEGWDHNPQWSHPRELVELLVMGGSD
ncbi:hypothetical protein VDG1235_2000 [Verrucomicrobiia bacterium DG1235]|nr:hypothetical protein VDG1235_2000 [Verrucomicrobiae bacterium DG1235]